MGKEIIIAALENIPENPGIYMMIGESNEVLYVGKAKNLRKRVASYPKNDQSQRIQHMVSLVHRLETQVTNSEMEALILENNMIKKFMPRYNILLRDDKSFTYIAISKSENHIKKHRGKFLDGFEYFGPFTCNAKSVEKSIDILKRAFLIQECRSEEEFANRTIPVDESTGYDIIKKDEYKKFLGFCRKFLYGKSGEAQEILSKKMLEYSMNLEFEKAARVRDFIEILASIQAKQIVEIIGIGDTDVITIKKNADNCCIFVAFYRDNKFYGGKDYYPTISEEDSESEILSYFLTQFYTENNAPKNITTSHDVNECVLNLIKVKQVRNTACVKALDKAKDKAEKFLNSRIVSNDNNCRIFAKIQEIFYLPTIPRIIDIYDNSHISGEYAVGVVVSIGIEGFIKDRYRIYNIKKTNSGNDCGMIEEVLTRRYSKVIKIPDFALIDGGEGQLSVAKKVFDKLGIKQNFATISKGVKRNDGNETFHQTNRKPFKIFDKSVLYYLERIRDEAHRFAITNHKNLRKKSVEKSELDNIEGIGKIKKLALLSHFGSISAIRNSDIENISLITGINTKLAKKILENLKK